MSPATSEGSRHPTKIASPPVVTSEGHTQPPRVASPLLASQAGPRQPVRTDSPSESQTVSGSRIPSRSGSSPVTMSQEISQLERPDSFSKPHATAVHSSSSDTGLERSQAISSSSDSHKEPWRLAFGSNASQLHKRAASQESVRQSPGTFSHVPHGSLSDLQKVSTSGAIRSPQVPEGHFSSRSQGSSRIHSPQRMSSTLLQGISSLPQSSSFGSLLGDKSERQERTVSVRPKEPKPRLSRQGTSGESDSWG